VRARAEGARAILPLRGDGETTRLVSFLRFMWALLVVCHASWVVCVPCLCAVSVFLMRAVFSARVRAAAIGRVRAWVGECGSGSCVPVVVALPPFSSLAADHQTPDRGRNRHHPASRACTPHPQRGGVAARAAIGAVFSLTIINTTPPARTPQTDSSTDMQRVMRNRRGSCRPAGGGTVFPSQREDKLLLLSTALINRLSE
jgi:hypothetical protein